MKKNIKKFKPNAKYSIPVFTLDKKYCVVYKSWTCGSLCGSGGTSLYRLENGKWLFVKSYSFWVS